MGIECSRSGVVHTHAGSDTHLLAGLFGFLGNRLEHVLVIVHADGAIISLRTGSKGSSGSRRVGDRICGRESGSHTGNRKSSKQQRLYTDTPFLFGKIHLGSVHLVYSHPISDEIKYILCLLGIHCTRQQHKEQHIHQSFHKSIHY